MRRLVVTTKLVFKPIRVGFTRIFTCSRTGSAGRIANDPTDRIAGRDRHQLFALLEGDDGHTPRAGVDLIQRAIRVGPDLDGIDVAFARGRDAGLRVGTRNAELFVHGFGHQLRVGLARQRFQLLGQRQRLGDLNHFDGLLRFRQLLRGNGNRLVQ